MKMLWCWRCKCEMPMLDEGEFAEIKQLYNECIRSRPEFRKKHGIPLESASIEQRIQPVLKRYEQMTGMKETNANAVMHHGLALYGPPCKRCGKPLRSPQAKLCGACMFPVDHPMRP